jgi:hypothetical protein
MSQACPDFQHSRHKQTDTSRLRAYCDVVDALIKSKIAWPIFHRYREHEGKPLVPVLLDLLMYGNACLLILLSRYRHCCSAAPGSSELFSLVLRYEDVLLKKRALHTLCQVNLRKKAPTPAPAFLKYRMLQYIMRAVTRLCCPTGGLHKLPLVLLAVPRLADSDDWLSGELLKRSVSFPGLVQHLTKSVMECLRDLQCMDDAVHGIHLLRRTVECSIWKGTDTDTILKGLYSGRPREQPLKQLKQLSHLRVSNRSCYTCLGFDSSGTGARNTSTTAVWLA